MLPHYDNPLVSYRREYSVVFITTEDVLKNNEPALLVLRSLFDVYAATYHSFCVIYSSNPDIVKMFDRPGFEVITSFPRNKYDMPFITPMLQGAMRFHARYYAYINADILVDPEMFRILAYIQQEVRKGNIQAKHEIAGRVYQFYNTHEPFSSTQSVQQYFESFEKRRSSLRNMYSAVTQR